MAIFCEYVRPVLSLCAKSVLSRDFYDNLVILEESSSQEETPKAHYKMNLKKRFECVFYNTKTETWITGTESGIVFCRVVFKRKKFGAELTVSEFLYKIFT